MPKAPCGDLGLRTSPLTDGLVHPGTLPAEGMQVRQGLGAWGAFHFREKSAQARSLMPARPATVRDRAAPARRPEPPARLAAPRGPEWDGSSLTPGPCGRCAPAERSEPTLRAPSCPIS